MSGEATIQPRDIVYDKKAPTMQFSKRAAGAGEPEAGQPLAEAGVPEAGDEAQPLAEPPAAKAGTGPKLPQ